VLELGCGPTGQEKELPQLPSEAGLGTVEFPESASPGGRGQLQEALEGSVQPAFPFHFGTWVFGIGPA